MNIKKKTEIKKFRDDMWLFWAGEKNLTPPCIRCFAPGVTLHEIIPRSLNTNWYKGGPEECVVVCQKCHDWAHLNGEASRAKLREMAVKRLQMIGMWRPDRILRHIKVEENDDD